MSLEVIIKQVRVNEVDAAIWQYVRIQAQTLNKSIPAFIADLVELHVKVNNKEKVLAMLQEEYSQNLKRKP